MKNNVIKSTVQGVVMGASMMIPGVSGGTTAILLGIYDQLISAVGSVFKTPRKSILTLLPFGVGGGIGILLFAKLLLKLTTLYEMPMMYLFLGAIVGSLPMLFRKTGAKRFSFSQVLFVLLGLILVILTDMLPKGAFEANAGAGIAGYLLIIAAGIITAVALVLPGISVSYMLLVLGVYDPMLKALNSYDFAFLIPLALSVAIGVLATTKVLETAMRKYPEATFLVIIGFVLGSLRDVYPGLPSGWEWLVCIATFALGCIAILYVSRFSKD